MFTDWTEALEAEALPLDPNPAQQLAAAARFTARRSRDKDDLGLLLDVLGLPTDTDTLTALLPLLTSPEGAPDMQQTPQTTAPNAFEATALSMFYADHPMAEITEATGLSEDEITALVDARQRKADAGETDDDTAPAATIDTTPKDPAVESSVEQLLAWAAAHPTAGIRNKAARVRGDLSELTTRRTSEAAQREAEEKIAKAKAELEKAQEELRTVKAGIRTTTTAAATAPNPIRAGLGSGRTREELAAVRAWARANGHQVADAGMVRKAVLQAYDAVHRAPVRKAG